MRKYIVLFGLLVQRNGYQTVTLETRVRLSHRPPSIFYIQLQLSRLERTADNRKVRGSIPRSWTSHDSICLELLGKFSLYQKKNFTQIFPNHLTGRIQDFDSWNGSSSLSKGANICRYGGTGRRVGLKIPSSKEGISSILIICTRGWVAPRYA